MKISTKLFFIALLCLKSLTLVAQQSDTLEIQHNENGAISFIRFKANDNRRIQDATNIFKTVLHEKPDDELRLSKETTDNIGMTHGLYQQYYKGIKVENAEYLVHGKNGVIQTVNGDFQSVNIPSIKPTVNEKQALNKALSFVNAKKYKWEDEGLEKLIKLNTNNSNATYYPSGELIITKDLIFGGRNLRLAWKFTVSSLTPNNEQIVYVDAISGQVIRVTPLIYDVNTPITAQTRYSGTIGITGDSFTGGLRLRESRNGVDVQTLNLQHTTNNSNAIDFVNTNANFTNGNWTNFNQDQVALDAHWGAENVLDYWRVVHSRNSLDGNGIRILGYVHYDVNWNNAQWVGGTNNHYMRYGDGDGANFNPLTALDITAHEMGHGITEFTAGLAAGTQESGALNEGFSDIYGACVEYWAAPNKQTWLIGEEIIANAGFNCIRNLQNPKSTTAAEGQHPDTFHGQFWDNNGEAHNNSTVLSHWFFLLTTGGSGTNDLGNTFALNGIGINDAQSIAYRAESVYLHSSATYNDARTATISAATDLFGSTSCQVISVTNAWFAVGVGNGYSNSVTSIVGSNQVCASNTYSYSVSNLPAGATVNWSASPANAVNISTNNSVATVTQNGSGPVNIIATVTNSCGTYDITKSVTVGGPLDYYNVQQMDNSAQFCANSRGNWMTIEPQNISDITYFEWGYTDVNSTAPPVVVNTMGSYTQDFSFPSGGNYEIYARAGNSCGLGITRTYNVYVSDNCGGGGGYGGFSAYPNPAGNSMTITTSSANTSSADATTSSSSNSTSTSNNAKSPFNYKIYNKTGKVLKQGSSSGEDAIVDTRDLASDNYFLHVFIGKQEIQRQIIIKH